MRHVWLVFLALITEPSLPGGYESRLKVLNLVVAGACPLPYEQGPGPQFLRELPDFPNPKVLPLELIEDEVNGSRLFLGVCLSARSEIRPGERSFNRALDLRFQVIAAAEGALEIL